MYDNEVLLNSAETNISSIANTQRKIKTTKNKNQKIDYKKTKRRSKIERTAHEKHDKKYSNDDSNTDQQPMSTPLEVDMEQKIIDRR